MDKITAIELRDILKNRFGIEIEGRLYRLQFDFEKNLCYTKIYDDKAILPPAPPKSTYVLNIHEIGADEPSEIPFPSLEALKKAYSSFKLLNKYHLWGAVDGKVIDESYPEKRRI